MKKAVVLFSGGQDSTTCLLWAIKKWGQENVVALGFDYGQRHRVELTCSIKILKLFPKVGQKIFNVHGALPQSALTDQKQDVSGQSEYDADLPASFTPGRNILFLTLAGSFAAAHGIENIVTGVCQTDYSGYPDCRHDFITAMEVALNKGLAKPISIITPLMFLTKAETWKLAKDLGSIDGWDPVEIIKDLTMTDYNGDQTMNEWGMGREDNPASILRAKGYREAKEAGWV